MATDRTLLPKITQLEHIPSAFTLQPSTIVAEKPLEIIEEDVEFYDIVSTSPNGTWHATSRAYAAHIPGEGGGFDQRRTTFTISSADGTKNWYLIDILQKSGAGVGVYETLLWTDETLFFGYNPQGSCEEDANALDVWRFDFATAELTQIFTYSTAGAEKRGTRGNLSISGDRWISQQLNGFSVHNLVNQEATLYEVSPLQNATFNTITISPNGEQILFVVSHYVHPYDCGQVREQVAIVADLATLQISTLAYFEHSGVDSMVWNQGSVATIKTYYGELLYLDTATGKFIQN